MTPRAGRLSNQLPWLRIRLEMKRHQEKLRDEEETIHHEIHPGLLRVRIGVGRVERQDASAQSGHSISPLRRRGAGTPRGIEVIRRRSGGIRDCFWLTVYTLLFRSYCLSLALLSVFFALAPGSKLRARSKEPRASHYMRIGAALSPRSGIRPHSAILTLVQALNTAITLSQGTSASYETRTENRSPPAPVELASF
jgi:hypothetical protein